MPSLATSPALTVAMRVVSETAYAVRRLHLSAMTEHTTDGYRDAAEHYNALSRAAVTAAGLSAQLELTAARYGRAELKHAVWAAASAVAEHAAGAAQTMDDLGMVMDDLCLTISDDDGYDVRQGCLALGGVIQLLTGALADFDAAARALTDYDAVGAVDAAVAAESEARASASDNATAEDYISHGEAARGLATVMREAADEWNHAASAIASAIAAAAEHLAETAIELAMAITTDDPYALPLTGDYGVAMARLDISLRSLPSITD